MQQSALRNFKIALTVSLLLNIVFIVLLTFFIHSRGGIDYIKRRLSTLVDRQTHSENSRDHTEKIRDDLKPIELEDSMVSGLPAFPHNQALARLPENQKARIRPELWDLSKQPSGGRIRFRTNSPIVSIDARSPDIATPPQMNNIMKNGFDLYSNNIYWGSAWPDEFGNINTIFEFDKDREFNDITIYLPLYEEININSININKSSEASPPKDLRHTKPMIFYGSSITQGGVASNPGLSYQAILSRSLKIDFINFGFDGNGLGDIQIANYISTLESSVIVLDYWANPSPEVFRQTLPEFTTAIRSRKNNTPILVIGPFYNINRAEELRDKRDAAQEFVRARRQGGDEHIHFFDGMEMVSKKTAFGLADGQHPNSLGFWFCAKALEPVIWELVDSQATH